MDQNNGGIIGKINTPTTSVASGVWSLDSQFDSQSGSTWPLAFPQTTIANSCRFETDTYMTKTASSGNTKTLTISFWCKRGRLGAVPSGSNQFPISFYQDSNNRISVAFTTDNTFTVYAGVGGSTKLYFVTNRLFRDHSAWYNMVIKIDTTQSTEADRFKLFINGIQETSFSTATYPSQNDDLIINTNIYVGVYDTSNNFYHGYLAEVIYVDGTAADQTSFGAINPVTNIWEPIAYTGAYGTNGFRLDFADSSNLGNDANGGTDLTEYNLVSTDQSTDTCSNNFATLNPIDKGYTGTITLSQGNLVTESSSGAGDTGLRSTIGVTTGKWYLEAKIASSNTIVIGDINARLQANMNDGSPADDFYGIQRYSDTKTNLYNDGTFVSQNTAMWGGFTSSDIISIALDLDNNKIFFAKNGSFKDSSGNTGDPANGTNPTFTISDGTKTYTFYTELRGNDADGLLINFGSPSFSISSGNADANGFGNFEYAVPSGYFALCTKNLAEFGG